MARILMGAPGWLGWDGDANFAATQDEMFL